MVIPVKKGEDIILMITRQLQRMIIISRPLEKNRCKTRVLIERTENEIDSHLQTEDIKP